VRAILDRAPTKDAAADARLVYAAVRKGSLFTAIDGLAGPALLDFHAVPSGATVTLLARVTMPPGGELVLMGPAGELARAERTLRYEVPADRPAAYRVEVRLSGAPGAPAVPWLVSNAIRVGAAPEPSAPSTESSVPGTEHTIAPFPWRIEKDAASLAIVRTSATAAELEYKLADGARNSQFVALATDLRDQAFSAIDLDLAVDRPTRLWVQARTVDGRRWGRTYYVDPAGTAIHVPLSSLKPLGTSAPSPAGSSVTSILLVVDLTNGAPGRSGQLTVRGSSLVK
jgi:hypothetical protein